VLAAAMAGCLFYAIDRTRAVLFEPAEEPLAIIASARIPYFFRIATGALIACIVFAGWLYLTRTRPRRAFTWAMRATLPVALFCCTLSVIWP